MGNVIFFLILFTTLVSSDGWKNYGDLDPIKDINNKKIEFKLKINKENYLNSIYGESPQIAIWLEEINSDRIKNVYVTYRAGKNDWVGKVNCKIAIPYWQSRLKSSDKNNELLQNEVEAVTSATSKTDIVLATVSLENKSEWKYFIEVNVSGDYNNEFKPVLNNGVPDYEGNGQPSIVYSGSINLKTDVISEPVIIGRTHQLSLRDSLFTDIHNITSAKNILEKIEIKIN